MCIRDRSYIVEWSFSFLEQLCLSLAGTTKLRVDAWRHLKWLYMGLLYWESLRCCLGTNMQEIYMPTEAPMHTDVHVYAIQHPFSTPNRLVIGSQCPVEDQIATTYTTPPFESNFVSLSISNISTARPTLLIAPSVHSAPEFFWMELACVAYWP